MNNQFLPPGWFMRPETWAYWMPNSLGARTLPELPEDTWNAGWPETSRGGILGRVAEPRGTWDRRTVTGARVASSFNAGGGILGLLTQSAAADLPPSLSTPMKEQIADDPPMRSRSPIISGANLLALLSRTKFESGSEPVPTARKKGDQAECDEMHRRDLFHCKMVGLPACYAQAYLRYTNCLNGRQIPPLNY